MDDFYPKWISESKLWETHLEKITKSDYLTPEQKDLVSRNLLNIKDSLGSDFLSKAVDEQHPILTYLTNLVPWTRWWLAEFGYDLSQLYGIKDFERLKKRLTTVKEFYGALVELKTASCLVQNGYKIELFPKVGTKEADIKALVNNREIFFEVTTLASSKDEILAGRTHNEIGKALFDSRIEFSCKIYKSLSKPHLEEIKDKIRDRVQRALSSNTLQELHKPYICLAVAPLEKRVELLNWSKEKNISGLEGPSYSFNPTPRLKSKIEKKANQLPTDKASILKIDTSHFWGVHPPELVSELEETVYEQQHIVALILLLPIDKKIDSPEVTDKYILVPQKIDNFTPDSFTRDTALIIKNRFSNFKCTDEELVSFVKRP